MDVVTKLGIPHEIWGETVIVLQCQKCQARLGRKTSVTAWVLRARLPGRGVCALVACKGCLSELMATYKRMGCHICTREVVAEQMQLLRTELELKFDHIMLVHVLCSTGCRDRSEMAVMRVLGVDAHRVCSSCGKNTDQRCSSCGVSMFCTRECMAKSWETHKVRCKAIGRYNVLAEQTTGSVWE